MEFSIYIWPLVCAAVIMYGINLYVQRFKELPAARPFALLAGLACLWAVIYAFHLAVISISLKIISAELLSLPQVFIPTVMLALILEYTGFPQWLNRKRLVLILVIPVITLLFSLTGTYHNLMRYHFSLDLSGPLPLLQFDRGPLYWCFFIYGYTLIAICSWLLIRSLRSRFLQPGNTACIMAGILIPMVSSLLFDLGITPIPGYDPTPSLFIVTGILYLWALIHYRLFTALPITLSSVLNNVGDPIIVLDIYGHITNFNSAALQLEGLKNTLVIGKRVDELPQKWAQLLTPYLDKRAAKEEVNIKNEEDERCTYELTVSTITNNLELVVGQIFLLHNITASKKSEEALRSSQQMLQSVLDNFPGMVFWKNRQYAYMGCNKAFALSSSRNEAANIIGKTDHQLGYPQAAADKYRAEDLQVLQSGIPILGMVTSHHNPDGSVNWLSTSKVPLVNAQGEIFGIIGISQDITQRKQAEEEVLQLNTNLEKRVQERTQQLEMLNKELASTSYSIAHDLKTPLRALDGFSHILLEEYNDQLDAEGKYYLERIRKATHRMGQLSDDLLKLLSITRSQVNLAPVDLSETAAEIIRRMQAAAPQRKLEFIHPESLIVNADRHLITLLLDCLLDNAWKFTKKRHPAQIVLGSTGQDNHRVFFIRDNGVGFDMTYAEKLFGVFQRLHKVTEFEGTGIGLALAQRVIHRHGGAIWAESAPDNGATFYFTLPQAGETDFKI
jgi:PAS domain S-box-containing protein